MTLLGLGQGASISLSLSYIAWRSPDARHTAQVSTMAQGFGYLLASLGPIAIGAIHAASGSWTVPLIVLAALLVPQLIAGVLASRERQVLAPARRHRVPAGARLDADGSRRGSKPGPLGRRIRLVHPWSRSRRHCRIAAMRGWPPADKRQRPAMRRQPHPSRVRDRAP